MSKMIPQETKKEFKSSLRELIIQKMSEKNLSSLELSKELSYVKIFVGAGRIKRIIDSDLLDFGKGEYDYRYITDEIIEAMCKVLEIDDSLRESEVEKIKIELKRIAERYHAKIKILCEENPKPTNWFSAMGMHNALTIKLSSDFVDKSFSEQKEEALLMCKRHYYEHRGKLFGKILSYKYFYADEKFLEFGVNEF